MENFLKIQGVNYINDSRVCDGKEAIYWTAVIEAASKSLEINSGWTEIEPLDI